MTDERRASMVSTVKTMLTIAGSTIALAALAVGAVAWFLGVQSKPEAAKQYEALRTEFQAADVLIDRKAEVAGRQIEEVGRDVKVIKCLVDPAKTAKQKRGCGLE